MTHFLVTTGPEAAGKTTLATDLSVALQAPLVTEQSRPYLTAFYQRDPNKRYQQGDLLAIARLQLAAEQAALTGNPPWIVCDTDLLVIMIWSEVRYGDCEPALLELFTNSLQSHPRTWLLCDPSMPWQPDPLRENPLDRAELFQRYLHKLQTMELPFKILTGAPATRLQLALGLNPTPLLR